VTEAAAASGVTLEPAVLARIDEVLGDVVERDPARTHDSSPKEREA
jgi:hypothetical protein